APGRGRRHVPVITGVEARPGDVRPPGGLRWRPGRGGAAAPRDGVGPGGLPRGGRDRIGEDHHALRPAGAGPAGGAGAVRRGLAGAATRAPARGAARGAARQRRGRGRGGDVRPRAAGAADASGPDRRGGGARRGGRGPAGRAQHRARRQCGHGPRQFPHRPPRPAGGAGRARRARPRGAVRAGRGVAAGGRGDAPVPRRAADRGLDGGRVPSHRRDRGGSGLAGRRWGDPGPRRAGGAPRREADAVTAALLLAGAVLAWPGNAAVARLRLLHEPGDRPAGLRRWLDGVPVSVLAPAAAGVAALLVAGPLQAAAAALLALTVADLRRRAAVRRGRLVRLGAWERALDDAISALTSGAGPEQALA